MSTAASDAEDTTATPESEDKPKKGIPALIAWVMRQRPVRVFLHFSASGGELLSAGMSFQAIFAIFAAIYVAFAAFGFALAGNPQLLDALISQMNDYLPGVFGDNGIVDPDALIHTQILGITGLIALAGLVLTAIGWLATTRDAVRRIFALPGDTTFFLLLKLKDLGLAIGYAVIFTISAALSVGSTEALGFLFGLFGWSTESTVGVIVARGTGLALAFVFDLIVLAGTFRLLSGVRIPWRRLIPGAALGALALGVLKALGTTLLGGATSNPILASFAVIIGLMIWFNFICRVILLSASWIAVGVQDAGIDLRHLSPEEARIEALEHEDEARRTVALAEQARLRERIASARGFERRRLSRELLKLEEENPTVPKGTEQSQ